MENDVLVYTPTGPASYELTAIVHEYSSLIWHEKCKEPGEVQLNAPKTETNLRALVEENVLMLENHTVGKAHQSGLVRGAIITEVTDSEDEEELVVSGRMLDWLLTWRTVPDSPKTGTGTYGAALYDLLAAGATFDAVRWLKSRSEYAAMGSDAGNPEYEQGELYETAQSLIGVENNLYFEVGFTPDPEPAPEPVPEWKTTGKVQSATVETIAGSNVGQTVIYGASRPGQGRLPEGYTELEYIESTGTQYIDTGFKPNSLTTKIEYSCEITGESPSFKGFFGCRDSSDRARSCAFFSYQNAIYFEWNGIGTVAVAYQYGKRYDIEAIGGKVTINGQSWPEGAKSDVYLSTNMLIGQTLDIDRVWEDGGLPQKIFECRVYDDGVFVRDFIPCKDQSGNVGMYDVVGSKFYGNSGEGAFVAGPGIVVPDEPMGEVGLSIGGEKWSIDLGGNTLGEGQVLTIQRDGSAEIDGSEVPNQIMPKMPVATVEISTASSLPHYFDLEYLQKGEGEEAEPTERPPLVLNIFQGRDLSSMVEFSTELANLKGFEITSGIADYRNVAKVVGEQTVWYPETGQPTGLDRREIYVDGSSVKSEDYYPLAPAGGLLDPDPPEGEEPEVVVEEGEPIPPEYQTAEQKAEIKARVKSALYQMGAEAVADHPKTESVNFEILDFGQYEYMEDWDLGDVVRVSDENKGLSFNMAITEVQEVFDKDGYRVVPTFGTPAVSLQKVIRRLKK